jgi:hypothetical protein
MVDSTIGLYPSGDLFGARCVDVTKRDDLHTAESQKILDVRATLESDAHKTDSHHIQCGSRERCRWRGAECRSLLKALDLLRREGSQPTRETKTDPCCTEAQQVTAVDRSIRFCAVSHLFLVEFSGT